MNTAKTCTACHQEIPRGEAVEIGDGHEVHAWHHGCVEAPERATRPTRFDGSGFVPEQRGPSEGS